jgi:hypothetical protein
MIVMVTVVVAIIVSTTPTASIVSVAIIAAATPGAVVVVIAISFASPVVVVIVVTASTAPVGANEITIPLLYFDAVPVDFPRVGQALLLFQDTAGCAIVDDFVFPVTANPLDLDLGRAIFNLDALKTELPELRDYPVGEGVGRSGRSRYHRDGHDKYGGFHHNLLSLPERNCPNTNGD